MARKNPHVGYHPDMFETGPVRESPVIVPWRELSREELEKLPAGNFTKRELLEIKDEDPELYQIIMLKPAQSAVDDKQEIIPAHVACYHCDNPFFPEELVRVYDRKHDSRSTEQWCPDCVANDAVKCDNCGEQVSDKAKVEVYDGKMEDWCPDCMEDPGASTCEDCSEAFSVRYINNIDVRTGRHTEQRLVCDDCKNASYTQCDRCDNYAGDDSEQQVGGVYNNAADSDEEWCRRCRENNSSYCDDHNISYSEFCPDCQNEEDDSELISDYHSHKNKAVPIQSPWTKRQRKPLYFGVELEVEVASGKDRDGYAQNVVSTMGKLLLGIEEDGSLNHGFEIITQPAGLDVHSEIWPKVNLEGLKSHDTSTCGLHVHVTRASISKLTLGKILRFVNAEVNREFLETFARRQFSERFAKRMVGLKLTEGTKQRADRYEAINLSNEKTVEFRFFKGSTKSLTILASLELVYALIRFCETVDLPKDTTRQEHSVSWDVYGSAQLAPIERLKQGDLTVVKFLDYVASDAMANETQYLRAYLVEKKLNDLPGMKKKILAPLPRKGPTRTRFNPK